VIDVVPQELLPTMPPIIALFAVDVIGLKKKPCGFKKSLSCDRITPGSTFTQASFALNSIMRLKCLEMSTTIPSPTHCPANEVPAARGMIDIFCALANAIISLRSAIVLGMATAKGSSLYCEASVAYSVRMSSSKCSVPSIREASFDNDFDRFCWFELIAKIAGIIVGLR